MATDSAKISCLICSSIISTENKVDKLDALFLLRILLEIPEKSELIKNINKLFKLGNICDSCGETIKQCKDIYGEICEQIEKFWAIQNKILESFSTSPLATIDSIKSKKDTAVIEDDYNIWVNECRIFVKNHDFTGFGYPFAVHDLETLLISCSPESPSQLTNDLFCSLKNEVAADVAEDSFDFDDDRLPVSEDPLCLSPSSVSPDAPNTPPQVDEDDEVNIKEELESEVEDDDKVDQDHHLSEQSEENSNDSDYNPSPSKKPRKSLPRSTRTRHSKKTNDDVYSDNETSSKKLKSEQLAKKMEKQQKNQPKSRFAKLYPQYKFVRDPKTRKFPCLEPSCPNASLNKTFMERHFEKYHIQKESETNLLGTTENENTLTKKPGRKFIVDDIYNCVKNPTTKKFHCSWPDCSKNYHDNHDLIFHMDRHNGTPRQKCPNCDKLFYSQCQLERHEQKIHLGGKVTKPFECDICGEKLACQGDVYAHKSFHHSTKAVNWKICEICGKRITRSGIAKHMKNIHRGDEGKPESRPFACHLCPSDFEREDRFKVHLLRKHDVWGSEEEKEEILKKLERKKELSAKWKCPVKKCRLGFVRERGLKKHVDEKHGGDWGDGEGNVEVDWYKFRCEECGKGFHHKQKFKEHCETHLDKEKRKMPFRCEICGKGFPRNARLKEHLQTHEEKEKKWGCDVCKVGFVEERLLEKHFNSQHHKWRVEREGELKRECDVCGKRFKNGRDVGVHKKHMHKN